MYHIKPLLVIKIGTAAITTEKGDLNKKVLDEMVRQIVVLHEKYRIVLVSSGAVGCGKGFLSHFSKTTANQKAAAAIGNPILIDYYREAFEKMGKIPVAQALCEKHHFINRISFLQIWETFQALWKSSIIPIVNENDVVADYEIRFSDNDELAVMIASGFSAEKLLFGTAIDGVLYEGKTIEKIKTFKEAGLQEINKKVSDLGRGGMYSKLQCAKKACSMGTDVVIFDVREEGNLLKAEKFQTGTFCEAKSDKFSSRKKWIALGGEIMGRVFIDEGAYEALKKRKSLLLVGAKKIKGDFDKGDLIEILLVDQNEIIGIGRTKISHEEVKKLQNKKGVELVHVDELVLTNN